MSQIAKQGLVEVHASGHTYCSVARRTVMDAWRVAEEANALTPAACTEWQEDRLITSISGHALAIAASNCVVALLVGWLPADQQVCYFPASYATLLGALFGVSHQPACYTRHRYTWL